MNPDSFHRLLKTLVDSGEAKTIIQAQQTFSGYGVRVVLSNSVQSSVTEQIIALTVINTASRCFMGNVIVECEVDLVLTAQGFEDQRLSEFCDWAGVIASSVSRKNWPVIDVRSDLQSMIPGAIRPWADGWVFGLGENIGSNGGLFAPACVAAGALAVSEAFSILRNDNPYAGKRDFLFSLWAMTEGREQGPTDSLQEVLKTGAWLVGLGHLGQAYCWTLGFFPGKFATLVLQDVDTVTESTISRVLSSRDNIGTMKTRLASEWLEKRGFSTRLVERRFDASTRVAAADPNIAFFGVDNASARRCCEHAGFNLVMDAGLGSGYRDFRAMRIRTFPGASSAAQIWSQDHETIEVAIAPAYATLVKEGHDLCGVTTLATRAVGAPFVGCYAAAILISQFFKRRLSAGGSDVLDVNLRNPRQVEIA